MIEKPLPGHLTLRHFKISQSRTISHAEMRQFGASGNQRICDSRVSLFPSRYELF